MYRVRVAESFLEAGVLLSKVDDLCSLLEEDGVRLTHNSHLANFIPLLCKQEKLHAEVKDAFVAAIFHGTM